MEPQAGEIIGGYEVLRALGSGGLGTIFEARTLASGEDVVLKFPDPALLGDPGIYERFRREFQIGSTLRHPGIARALAMESDDRYGPYLVEEFVEGTPFRAYLDAHAPLAAHEVVTIAKSLAGILSYAHDAGVYHRDLKPDNLIIQSDGTIHVVDFGAALQEGARRLTWRFMGQQLGTPNYMSPEQIQGKRGDARTDIYALGVMLYEMLTGRVPFQGRNALAVMEQHVNNTPRAPRSLNPAVPPGLDAITMKALRKNPDERYQTAAELLADLERWDTLDPARLRLSPETQGHYSESRQIFVGAAMGAVVILVSAIAVVVGYLLERR